MEVYFVRCGKIAGTSGVLWKFRKIHRKTPMPGSKACNVIKKETLAQVFSCEFCEISKNTFFAEHLWTTAS